MSKRRFGAVGIGLATIAVATLLGPFIAHQFKNHDLGLVMDLLVAVLVGFSGGRVALAVWVSDV